MIVYTFLRVVAHNIPLIDFQVDLLEPPEYITKAKEKHGHDQNKVNYILIIDPNSCHDKIIII